MTPFGHYAAAAAACTRFPKVASSVHRSIYREQVCTYPPVVPHGRPPRVGYMRPRTRHPVNRIANRTRGAHAERTQNSNDRPQKHRVTLQPRRMFAWAIATTACLVVSAIFTVSVVIMSRDSATPATRGVDCLPPRAVLRFI